VDLTAEAGSTLGKVSSVAIRGSKFAQKCLGCFSPEARRGSPRGRAELEAIRTDALVLDSIGFFYPGGPATSRPGDFPLHFLEPRRKPAVT